MRIRLLAALAASVIAAPALAQTPPPPVLSAPRSQPAPLTLPQTWDELPEGVRNRYAPRLGRFDFQSVLNIEAAEVSNLPRRIEPGKMVVLQKASPAAAVRLTSEPARGSYGSAGSVLWQVRADNVEYWCLRGKTAINLPNGPFYCYRDEDQDGDFDKLFEASFPPPESAFQVRFRGKAEDIKKPVSYAPTPPPAISEIIGVRYKGVRGGYIDSTDHIGSGVVVFELIGGKDERSNLVFQTLEVKLDLQGRGILLLDDGQAIGIEKVEVGGGAVITYFGKPQSGVGYLRPPVTREGAVQQVRALLTWMKQGRTP